MMSKTAVTLVAVAAASTNAFTAPFVTRPATSSAPRRASPLLATTNASPFLPRATSSRSATTTALGASSSGSDYDYALIFDCDGVIIETEELHRLAYNAAFDAADLNIDGAPVEWTVEYYDVLQNTVGGGKPKMFHHFRETCGGQFPSYTSDEGKGESMPPPETDEEKQALIDALQAHKTELYKQMIAEKAVPRPGVLELMDEALSDPSVAVGVCSASTKEAVTKVLNVVLGEDRRKRLDVCILGNDVSKLKPDPMIYRTAAERIDIDPSRCVVVEDSMVGLRAAKGAGMKCLITYTSSTAAEDFYGEGADAKVPELGGRGVTLEQIFGPLRELGLDADIVSEAKDPVGSPASSV